MFLIDESEIKESERRSSQNSVQSVKSDRSGSSVMEVKMSGISY